MEELKTVGVIIVSNYKLGGENGRFSGIRGGFVILSSMYQGTVLCFLLSLSIIVIPSSLSPG